MSAAVGRVGRVRRFAATAVDFLLVGLAGLALVIATGAFEDAEDYAGNVLLRIVAFGFATYFLVNGLLLWRRGQTVGKALFGLVVVGAGTDIPAPLWRLVARAPFFMALYGVSLGWPALIVLVDHAFIFGVKRRCLHDLVCGTEVVRRDG